jgi:LPXTG-site transpeptidase (sortase) family protein
MNSTNSALPTKPKSALAVSKLRPSVLHTALTLIGLGLLGFAGYGLWQKYSATHNPHPLPASSTVVTQSTARPNETPVPSTSTYSVPADQPRRINLPRIGAEGFIQKVATDQTGAMAVPSNVHMAGWFVGETKPGDNGLSIIDGHVQGKYEPGIFKNLDMLRTGDVFAVEFGDQSERHFQVSSVKSYSIEQAAHEMFVTQPDISQQLNLITCGGRFNAQQHLYEQRTIVISKRID